MKSLRDIFKNRGPISDEEMQAYLSGTLSEKEMHKIELKLSEDEFNEDALSGFEEVGVGAFGAFSEAKETIHTNISKSSGGWQMMHTLMLLVFASIGVAMLAPVIFNTNENFQTPEWYDEQVKTKEYKKREVVIADLKNELDPENGIEEVEALTDEEIDVAIVLPVFEMISPKQIIEESPIVLDTASFIDEHSIFDEVQEIVEEVKNRDTILNPVLMDELVYSDVPLVYNFGFLMVNYSKIYTEDIEISKIVMTGTSAAQENADDQLNEAQTTEILTQSIPYNEYIADAQELFSKSDFKSALKMYKVVLKKYPEDLNALFYSGLCYYNLGKYKHALKYFDVSQKHPFNTFKIDAQWYKAKTYYQWGKNQSCQNVLEQIIELDNYYSEQAKKLLKTL